MNAAARRPPPDAACAGSGAVVVAWAAARIARALAGRRRYRYVRPRVEPEHGGWKVVSANCSRSVDPGGGDIAIAWFEPDADGLWRLHARDHTTGRWRPVAERLPLDEALARVCRDAERVFWP